MDTTIQTAQDLEGPELLIEPADSPSPNGNAAVSLEAAIKDAAQHSIPNPDSPEFLSYLRSAGIKNRSTLTLCINLLTDHPAEFVVAYNDHSATIYRVCHDGVLSRSDSEFAPLLLATRNALTYAPDAPGPSDKGFPYHAIWCNKLAEPGAIQALDKVSLQAYGLLQSQPAVLIPRFVPDSEIGRDLACIGTPEGVLDFRTLQILPKDQAREKLIFGRTPTNFIPGAAHDRVNEFMPDYETASPEERHRQDLLGFDLTHPPTRHFGWEINEGGSGKTTEKNILAETLGTALINEMRPESIQRNDGYGKDSSSHNAELFNLAAPARRTYVPDFGKGGKQGGADVPLINSITGGEARITARKIRQDAVPFRPTSTLIIQGNRPRPGDTLLGLDPTPQSQDAAIIDRAQAIVIPKPDSPDPWFRDKAPYDPHFREAVFYRAALAAQRQSDADAPPPMPAGAISNRDQTINDDLPAWKREWLANAFEPREIQDTAAAIDPSAPQVTSLSGFADYESWHKAYGSGQPATRTAVTNAMTDSYQKAFPNDPPPHRGNAPRGAPRGGKCFYYPRWQHAADPD